MGYREVWRGLNPHVLPPLPPLRPAFRLCDYASSCPPSDAESWEESGEESEEESGEEFVDDDTATEVYVDGDCSEANLSPALAVANE